jgi:Ca-activated chloride channel family protein
MIIGLARPEGVVAQSEQRGIVVLSIDVSGSMLAEDVSPNRMEATKKAARDFVNKQPPGIQVGIVSFSDFGALVQPPTKDKKLATKAIDRLQPERGTNIGGGLEVALDSIYEALDLAPPTATTNQNPAGGPAQRAPTPIPTPAPDASQSTPMPASIVLVSDGQSNTGPPPLKVADEAKSAGIKVYTVGIGTAEGTVLRIQGRSVFTRLDEETLQGIADDTGAHYYNAQDSNQLEKVYGELARQRQSEPQQTELTYYFTGAALLVSVIAGAFSLLWFNRLP